jgi:hypothetical protein
MLTPKHEDSFLKQLCIGLIMIIAISAAGFAYLQSQKPETPTYLGTDYISVSYPASQL